MNRAYKLLGILQSYAPTFEAQNKCAKIYRNIQEDNNLDDDKTSHALIGILHDGVAYGNWPWTDYNISE